LRLRYAPDIGNSLHRLVWTEGTIAFGEGTVGQPLADSVVLDLNALHSVTQTVRGHEAANLVVQVQLDSSRTRMRARGGSWKLVAADTIGPQVGMFVFDDRLRIHQVRGAAGDSIAPDLVRELRDALPGFEAALPETAVRVGEGWTSDIVFPLGELIEFDQQDLPTSVAPGTEFVVRAAFLLDSLMARGTDTLAFVGVSGNFMPMTVGAAPQSGQGNVQVSGAFSGRLIWSTAWSAYVSGAIRTGVHMAQEPDRNMMGQGVAPDAPAVLVRLDITQRFQVRQ